MKSPMKVVRGFVGPLVDEGMKNKGRGRGSLLDHLVNMTDGETLSNRNLKDAGKLILGK